MIDPHIALIPLLILHQIGEVVVEASRAGGRRVGVDHLNADGIPAIRRNLSPRELIARETGSQRACRERIEDGRRFGEIAGAHFNRRDIAQQKLLRIAAVTFIIDKEKRVILAVIEFGDDYGSTKR